MTKEELVHEIRRDTGCMKTAVEKVLNCAMLEISEALSRGECVKLKGFGTFSTEKRASKVGRNMSTGEITQIPERVVPVFKPGKALSKSVAAKGEKGVSK